MPGPLYSRWSVALMGVTPAGACDERPTTRWGRALLVTVLLLVAMAAAEVSGIAAVGMGGGCDEQVVLDEADALTRAYCREYPDAWTTHWTLRQWGTLLAPALLLLGLVLAAAVRWLWARPRLAVRMLHAAWVSSLVWAAAGWAPVLVRAL